MPCEMSVVMCSKRNARNLLRAFVSGGMPKSNQFVNDLIAVYNLSLFLKRKYVENVENTAQINKFR